MNNSSFFILLSVILLILICSKKRKFSTFGKSKNKSKSKYVNNGFANIKDPYTMPIVKSNMVTPQEANHILKSAESSFSDSKIIGGMDKNIRKSQTTWLYTSDPIIYNLVKRISQDYGYPMENAEPLQVVKYEPGGFYNEHHDACCDNDDKCTTFVDDGGQRVLTALIYLNSDFTDGGTEFPEIKKIIKPPEYGGVIFRPLADNSNKCHPLGLHKGMPVTSGIKYVCNLWIREGPYRTN